MGLSACAGTHGGSLPGIDAASAARPLAAATPPVTAPVTIPYPYTNVSTTTTYKSASAKGVSKTTHETGTTTVQFLLDKKTGVYLVPETIKSSLGYTEVLDSAIAFPQYNGGTAQIILSDNYTYTQGTYTETGLDTYPQGQNSFDFPLTKGLRWSAAAAHVSSDNQTVTGSGAFSQNDASNVTADGQYTAQTSFSSTGGSNQDNYASTTSVSLSAASVYTLSEPAAGYNTLTQTFKMPASAGKSIPVTSSGKKPIPYAAGTVNVPNWYPNGKLPRALYADNYLVPGTAAMPSTCGKTWSGKTASVVLENNIDVDPVQGFNNTSRTTYYLTSLAKGQFWFACIITNYTDATYANGWVNGAGAWGKPSSVTTGVETLIATGAKPSLQSSASIPALHTLAFITPHSARRLGAAPGSLRR